jgi:hypothetical protein
MKKIDLFYHLPTNEYLNKQEVRKLYYNISVPNRDWDEEIYEIFNVLPVYEDEVPESTTDYYYRINDKPTIKEDYHLYEYTKYNYDKVALQTQYDAAWQDVRSKRNALLQETDWTQLPDSPLSDDDKLFYREYRQELRDITKYGNIEDVEWPVDPYKDLLVSII